MSATRYRMHFWRGLLASYSLMVIGGILLSVWTIADYGLASYFSALALAMIPGAIWALISQFVLCYIYVVDVSAKEFGGATFWGRKRFVSWNLVRSARRYYWLTMGLIYVRFIDGSPALWLPTHVGRQSALIEDLRSFAPPDSPLWASFRA